MGDFSRNEQQALKAGSQTTPHIADERDMAKAVFERYGGNEPIAIVPVKGEAGKRPDTYVVLMSGTEAQNPTQATWFNQDASAAANLDDRYRQSVRNALDECGVRKSDKLIFAGHSLGGMEAQNIVADPKFKEKYTATEVHTFGSPKTAPEQPGVAYHRYSTVDDPVPRWCSAGSATGLDGGRQVTVPNNLHAPMKDPIGQHNRYPETEALEGYKVNGRQGLTLDGSQMKTFSARQDRSEEIIERGGRQISGKLAEIYEQRRAAAAASHAQPSGRQSLAEQMREKSGRTGPAPSHQETPGIRKGGH
ncbi:MAG TPA: hypothetical protein VME43_13525 [Bryobacteraceae bacterium]|nr:hypothetical protein [Bryobacteraceae bacterium]